MENKKLIENQDTGFDREFKWISTCYVITDTKFAIDKSNSGYNLV